jgi:hypothetical protein
MGMNDADRKELEELREKVKRIEQTQADHRDPNVLLLEGQLGTYEGEYSALSVTSGPMHTYLSEVIEKLMGWNNIATFQWHIASEPKSFYELEEALVKTSMGEVDASFYHSYSDLTGYLWTNEEIKVGGHDLLGEIIQTMNSLPSGPKYLAMRVERKPK